MNEGIKYLFLGIGIGSLVMGLWCVFCVWLVIDKRGK